MTDTSAGGPSLSIAPQTVEVDDAGTRYTDGVDRLGGKPAARENRGVLDRGDQQPLRRHSTTAPQSGRQRQRIRFGAA